MGIIRGGIRGAVIGGLIGAVIGFAVLFILGLSVFLGFSDGADVGWAAYIGFWFGVPNGGGVGAVLGFFIGLMMRFLKKAAALSRMS